MAVQNRELHKLLVAQLDRSMQMTESQFVLEHLRKVGLGPYLPLASERMAKDVESICVRFGLTEDQAIKWMFNQVVETTSGQ